MKLNLSGKTGVVFAVVLIVILVALRFLYLSADPPTMFWKLGQGLLTDPYYYTYFARNAVLFDDWDPFDYDRYKNFQYSLVSGAAYLTFSLLGVSRVTAHITSIILNLGGALFFLLAVHDRKRPAVVVFTALMLLSNVMFFFWSRYPILENGMIFLIGLVCFLFLKYGHKWWGLFATGAAIALTALLGKLVGGIMLAPVLACLLVRHRRRAALPILITGLGILATSYLYLLTFYNGSPNEFIHYLDEVRSTLGGSPGLTSASTFFWALLAYLSTPAVLPFNTVLILAALLGWIAYAVTKPGDGPPDEEWPVVFAGIWVVAALAMLSPHTYRPIRHALLLFMPLSLLAGFLCARLVEKKLRLCGSRSALTWLGLFVCIALTIPVLIAMFADSFEAPTLVAKWAIPIVVVSAVVTLLLYLLTRGGSVRIDRWGRWPALLLILGFTAAQNGHILYRGLSERHYHMKRFNTELIELLPPHAILTGTNAPALTIDNSFKGVFDFFGPMPGDSDFFDRYPVTHLAVAPGTWQKRKKHYRLEDRATYLFQRLTRGADMRLYRIEQPGYKKSRFEELVDAMYDGDATKALHLADALAQAHPDNIIVLAYRLRVLLATADEKDVFREVEDASRRCPTSFEVQWACASTCAIYYGFTQEQSALDRAKQYLKLANDIYPGTPISLEDLLARTRPGSD